MKPNRYRNRQPLEYLPNDFRSVLKSRRFYTRTFIFRRRRRKLPGVFVGVIGIALLIAGELIKETVGLVLFDVGAVLTGVGIHFEVINRVVRQFKYFIVPGVACILFLVFLLRPQVFTPVLPRQYVPAIVSFSSGFPFDSTELTVNFGGVGRVSATYTRQQLERAKQDPGLDSISGIPFAIYLDRGKLFVNADIYGGFDEPSVRIKKNVISGLPFRWDGNFDAKSLEIVTADTVPVFQLLFTSADTIRVNGVFQGKGELVIADESGVSRARGKRVLFYGVRPIFKYPSWKYPHRSLFSSPTR